jgi:hypothetical protein
MSGKWSGLAPAVNAHLARWRTSNQAMPLVRRAKAQSHISEWKTDALMAALQNPWVYHWMLFAASYGIVNDEGQPMASLAIQDGQTASGREQFKSEEMAIGQGIHLAEREHFMLSHAVTHYVSAEVLNEIDEAAELAEYEPLFHTDLFVPNGFAVFERPIVFPDLDPDSGRPHPTIKVHVRAIGWNSEPAIWNEKGQASIPGVSVFFYTTNDDYATGFYHTMTEAGLEPPFLPEEAADGLIPLEVIPWCFGVSWEPREEVGYRPGTVPTPIAMQRRWFLAFMRLMWQEIIVRHPQSVGRAESRRWMRAKKPVLDYTVLRLRREVDPLYKTPGGGVALDMRIRVRGHWRHQYYPSLGEARHADGTMNPESHRLIWIEPFWKGPEDAPLGPLHSATSVVR